MGKAAWRPDNHLQPTERFNKRPLKFRAAIAERPIERGAAGPYRSAYVGPRRRTSVSLSLGLLLVALLLFRHAFACAAPPGSFWDRRRDRESRFVLRRG